MGIIMPVSINKVARMELEPEEEIELLRRQLEEFTASTPEVGAVLSLGHGITIRMATILCILVKRSPAVVSKNALHAIFFGNQSDGGPDPKVFNNYLSRLRSTLRRLNCPGEVITVWNAGWKADPALVKWVKKVYRDNMPQED